MAGEFEPTSILTYDDDGAMQFLPPWQYTKQQMRAAFGPNPHASLAAHERISRTLDDRRAEARALRHEADSLVRIYELDASPQVRSLKLARAARLYVSADTIEFPTIGGPEATALRRESEALAQAAATVRDDVQRSCRFAHAAALIRKANAIQYGPQ